MTIYAIVSLNRISRVSPVDLLCLKISCAVRLRIGYV